MDKKRWLDYLYYEVGRQHHNFEVCGLKKEGDKVIATRWKKYLDAVSIVDVNEDHKLDWINNRTIFPFELVLDIEDQKKLREVKNKIRKACLNNCYIYESGSRGYHIHIFFRENLTQEIKERWIEYFGADITKAGSRVMIALENCAHWKTGREKKLIGIIK